MKPALKKTALIAGNGDETEGGGIRAQAADHRSHVAPHRGRRVLRVAPAARGGQTDRMEEFAARRQTAEMQVPVHGGAPDKVGSPRQPRHGRGDVAPYRTLRA